MSPSHSYNCERIPTEREQHNTIDEEAVQGSQMHVGDAILNEWMDWLGSECQTREIIDSRTTYLACVYIPIPAKISP